jgi:signal peptidase I
MGQKSVFREYFEALLIAVIFATFAKTWVVQAFKIPTGSMEENLLVGDHILVNKFVYGASPTALERGLLPVRDIQRGDVVVFKYPEDPQRDFIKRCVGLPNDLIEVRNKRLFVNGQEVDDESYI